MTASIITSAARRPWRILQFPKTRSAARGSIRERVPATPGVYGWLDASGQLNYVGKAKSLRARLLQYFDKSPSDNKVRRIRRLSRHIVWEATTHELLALIREQELILTFRPTLNVQGQPHRRQPGFVCISKGPAPKVFIAKSVPHQTTTWFGPVSGLNQLNQAAVALNYVFRLRDCPDKTRFHFNNQLQLFDLAHNAQCIRFELQTCPGPCAAACSEKTYRDNVDQAIQFLRGENDNQVVSQLAVAMNQVASRQAYERAAVIRDQLDVLNWLSHRLASLRKAEQALNGVYELPGNSKPIWLWLQKGELIGSCQRQREMPKSIGRKLNSLTPWQSLSHDTGSIYLKTILMSWFRNRPGETAKLSDPFPQQTGRQPAAA